MTTTTTTSPASQQRRNSRPRSASSGTGKAARQPQTLKTWVFDSVGPRKYALQVCKAGNGNPSVRIVEGVPQDDGSYRKFNITVWSEDFERFFDLVDELRDYLKTNDIKTPPGHKYRPKSPQK